LGDVGHPGERGDRLEPNIGEVADLELASTGSFALALSWLGASRRPKQEHGRQPGSVPRWRRCLRSASAGSRVSPRSRRGSGLAAHAATAFARPSASAFRDHVAGHVSQAAAGRAAVTPART
jgi:hypothetical protein